ncbi:MAG: hypothetical protein H7Z72_21915 [Bacteroidetes bacterium]|nr:hypothetical protein [Fibrella sp.]
MKSNLTSVSMPCGVASGQRLMARFTFVACLFAVSLSFWSCDMLKGLKKEQAPTIVLVPVKSTVNVGEKITLDASGTSGGVAYNWIFKSRPPGSRATISNANQAVAEFVPDVPGVYIIEVSVTSDGNLTSKQETTITINVPGKPPVVSAGQSGTAANGQKFVLDGSKTADPDGNRLTYQWTFKSKPAGSTAAISSADNALASFTPDVLGAYVVVLTVSDGNWPPVTAEVTITSVLPIGQSIAGSWTAEEGTSGGGDYSPRNHFYTFQVGGNNQPVSLTVASANINVGLYVYDPLGKPVDPYGTGYARSSKEDMVLNAGTYTVMVTTSARYDIGAYTLRGTRMSSVFTRIPTVRVKALNVGFGLEGGGGTTYSPRNHFYTFEVTEDNSYIDINAQLAQSTLWFDLAGPSGARVVYSYVGTPRAEIVKLNKGVYSLWLGTGQRDAIANYNLDVFGNVQNLKQYQFDSAIVPDAYIGKGGKITYTLNVTENNTALDVSLRSPDVTGAFWVYNPNGQQIAYSYNGNYQWVNESVSKGAYQIVLEPGSNTSGLGKYTLSVYGKFADLKKQ